MHCSLAFIKKKNFPLIEQKYQFSTGKVFLPLQNQSKNFLFKKLSSAKWSTRANLYASVQVTKINIKSFFQLTCTATAREEICCNLSNKTCLQKAHNDTFGR